MVVDNCKYSINKVLRVHTGPLKILKTSSLLEVTITLNFCSDKTQLEGQLITYLTSHGPVFLHLLPAIDEQKLFFSVKQQ